MLLKRGTESAVQKHNFTNCINGLRYVREREPLLELQQSHLKAGKS